MILKKSHFKTIDLNIPHPWDIYECINEAQHDVQKHMIDFGLPIKFSIGAEVEFKQQNSDEILVVSWVSTILITLINIIELNKGWVDMMESFVHADKKAVLNIQNTDNKYFMWCILANLHKVFFFNPSV